MSTNTRTTFEAAELVRAAKASSSSSSQMIPVTRERNFTSTYTRTSDSERVDSGLGMEISADSLRSDVGIESGEEVERDHTIKVVARETTLHTSLRQPKAEHEERWNGRLTTHTHIDTQFGCLPKVNSIPSVTRTHGRTQIRNPRMNYANVSDQRLNEKPCLQEEEQRIVQYLLPNRDGDT